MVACSVFFPRAARELIYLIFAEPCRFGRIAVLFGLRPELKVVFGFWIRY